MFPMRRKGAQFWTGVTGPHPNGARRSFVVGSHASEHVGGNGSKKRRHITRVTSDVGNAVTLHTREDKPGPDSNVSSSRGRRQARCHSLLFAE